MKFEIALLVLASLASIPSALGQEEDTLLVANTRGNTTIVSYNLVNKSLKEYASVSMGIYSPDHMVIYDGALYISMGDTLENSAIAKMTADGTIDSAFATGGGLKRPYGFAFDNHTLYVASFMSDQVLMYDAHSGNYTGVFAQGNATEQGLCNGPNQIAIHDGKLYLTTQGSFVDENGSLNYTFNSQTIVYDLSSGEGEVFLPPPTVLETSLGFVSMLGIYIGCDSESAITDACTLYTTDFGGGLRAYNLDTKELLYASETTIDGGSTGSLAYDTATDSIYIPVFFNDTYGGAVLKFSASNGAPLEAAETAVLVADDNVLTRPIGALYIPAGGFEKPDDPEMPTSASSLVGLVQLSVVIACMVVL